MFQKDEGHFAPDFNEDKQVLNQEEVNESEPTLWKINNKIDSYVFDLRMSWATLLTTNKLTAVFAKTFFTGKQEAKGQMCFDVFAEYKKHKKEDPEKNP